MKRFLALTLALILCLGVFVGCQPKEVWEQTVFSFGENQTAYKYYGRVGQSEKGVEIAWPASGVEFTLKCSGDVTMNYSSVNDAIMHVSVDGAEPVRPKIKKGNKTLTLAEGLPEGEHTFRVLYDNDINGGGATITFKELEFYGVKASVKATPNKDVFIEFVGDSITSGKGVLQQGGSYEAVDTSHSPTHAYAVRTAEALDADWSLISRGSCGYFRVKSCPYTANEIYPYLNRFALKPVEYTFPRKADISVIALGTNDGRDITTEEAMVAAMKQLIGQVRAAHGEETPVVLLYGMMTANWEDQFIEVAESMDNVFYLRVPRNNEGGNDHPDEEAMIVTAEKLTHLLQELVIPTLQK